MEVRNSLLWLFICLSNHSVSLCSLGTCCLTVVPMRWLPADGSRRMLRFTCSEIIFEAHHCHTQYWENKHTANGLQPVHRTSALRCDKGHKARRVSVASMQNLTPTSQHLKFLGVCVQVLDGCQERSCEFNAANIVFVFLLIQSQCSQLSQLVPLIILFYSNIT